MFKTLLKLAGLAAVAATLSAPVAALTPEEISKLPYMKSPEAFRDYMWDYNMKRYPQVKKEDFVNGLYAINESFKEEWLAVEEFPPYELNVEAGEKIWNTPFANGKSYKDCFKKDIADIRPNYPYFNTETKKVHNMETDINACLKANGEAEYKLNDKKLFDLTAYITAQSKGKPINVTIPNKDAEATFWKGMELFFTKTGQFNLACADCHHAYSGMYARAEQLSPSVGKTASFPVYRKKSEGMVSMQDRLFGCYRDSRAKTLPHGHEDFMALEYFMSYLDSGLPVSGPISRR